MTTLQEIQILIDETPSGEACFFPGGIIDCPDFTGLDITKSIIIFGNNTVFNLPVSGQPSRSFLRADTLPNGSYLQINDLTINGPSTEGWVLDVELSSRSLISYSLYKTWDSKMILNNVTTRGGYSYGVSRAGGGILEIKNCSLSGWVGGISFFEGHGGWGDLILRDTELPAPPNSKYSSIGIYIHPHLHLNAERVTASNWNRYAIYLNGTPQSAGHHNLIEVTANNCSLIQTGSSSITTLIRCVEQGIPKNGGSYFKGPVLAVDCSWTGKGMVGFLSNMNCKRTFIRNTIAPQGRFAALGSNTQGELEFISCNVELNGVSSLAAITNTSTANIVLNSTIFSGNSTKLPLVIEGGTIKVINGQLPANSRIVLPGVLI